MKLMFISDIHGSEKYIKRAVEAYKREKADKLIILGDILYHGPRNPLPEGYDPKGVISILNNLKSDIIAVRGNCDSEVDQMVLEFPIMSDYNILMTEERSIFMTHGHLFNKDNMPALSDGDVLIYGHVHVPISEIVDHKIVLNPGSITLPKNFSTHSYGIIEDNHFYVKALDGNVLQVTDLRVF